MSLTLVCRDGVIVRHLEPAGSGRSHRVYFGSQAATGAPVVVKMELLKGRLAREHTALCWLGPLGASVPAVCFYGPGHLDDQAWTPCLVTDRINGSPPTTPEAWSRMGRALADLAPLPWKHSDLPVTDADDFIRTHHHKIAELAGALRSTPEAAMIAALARWPSPPLGPLVVTHGDPGPGNYLETTTQTVLIDWEQTHVAPRGFDIARAAFIALLDSARRLEPTNRANATAVLGGYLGAGDWQPDAKELRWWIGVAGVTFIYNRWRRRGQDRVLAWLDAAAVLANTLDNDAWLNPIHLNRQNHHPDQ